MTKQTFKPELTEWEREVIARALVFYHSQWARTDWTWSPTARGQLLDLARKFETLEPKRRKPAAISANAMQGRVS